MTFNDSAKIDSSKVRRRGRTTGIAAGGGGIAVVAIFLISQFLGVDLSGLAGGGAGTADAPDEAIVACDTGAEANNDLDCRIAAATDSLDTYWSTQLPGTGVAYRTPGVVLFDARADTGCGAASSATGPFYCPPDETVYIDPTFYEELRTRFGSSGGPLAEMYVVAHEWGHHVQNLSGTMNGLDLQATGPTSDSVRLEVQADCFAGAWVGAATSVRDVDGTTFLKPVTAEQITDALSAASAVGDDRIQQAATGEVNPESWTHGSSEQRQKWFNAGLAGGPAACDTFAAASLG
jgi:predicted metalloprotease